jgi:hypothetical protein
LSGSEVIVSFPTAATALRQKRQVARDHATDLVAIAAVEVDTGQVRGFEHCADRDAWSASFDPGDGLRGDSGSLGKNSNTPTASQARRSDALAEDAHRLAGRAR